MAFNLGNNDRQPNFGATNPTGHGSKNPLQQATNPANTRGGDMVLTPDHPSWHADHTSDGLSSSQKAHRNTSSEAGSESHGAAIFPSSSGTAGGSSSNQGGFHHDPHAPYTGGRVTNTAVNRGPFRAGPDNNSFLPPGAVPQGARFDPIMPDNVRQELPGRGDPARQQGGRSGPSGFASGEPDNDELQTPDWTR
ncbi:hypothetical protein BGZ70_009009 [Mortierella alpina]|uniref:Uncharacterized protein n=1 Tax=Mortierella alpina TaxID=64518 RepID=A0A9P6M080_MORAP|nr:hypothetical protein BGZ70_009009 [Mortierella alpina]